MLRFSIGEVARQMAIRTSAIRYYEEVGLLPAPPRSNGRRIYDESALQRLSLIQFLQKAGFTVAEMQTLLHGFTPDTRPAERWQALAYKKIGEMDEIIAQAQKMKSFLAQGLQCGCLRIEDCVIISEVGCTQPESPL